MQQIEPTIQPDSPVPPPLEQWRAGTRSLDWGRHLKQLLDDRAFNDLPVVRGRRHLEHPFGVASEEAPALDGLPEDITTPPREFQGLAVLAVTRGQPVVADHQHAPVPRIAEDVLIGRVTERDELFEQSRSRRPLR